MSFNDMLADDAAAFLAEFGESGVYVKADGTRRTITVIADRDPPAVVGQGGQILTPKLSIEAANSAATGISSGELDASGNDRFEIAVRIGGSVQSLGVYLPEAGGNRAHDAGMISLDLR